LSQYDDVDAAAPKCPPATAAGRSLALNNLAHSLYLRYNGSSRPEDFEVISLLVIRTVDNSHVMSELDKE
jgi:hypothetical protein